MARNPFTPSFGVTPPLLVGRDEEIATFRDSLEDGPGSPGRAMLFTGARGSGKTVMLNAVEDVARECGWVVVSITTRKGIAQELKDTILPDLLAEHADDAVRSTLVQANVAGPGVGAGFTRQRIERYPRTPSLRWELEALTDALASRGSGVLITLDEVHTSVPDDLREIIHAVQHGFREDRQLALVAAGLPSSVEDLLNDDVMTFLRRAEKFAMGEVALKDVTKALREPIEASGRIIDDEGLRTAAAGTRGYPFLIQLVGHQMWNVDRDAASIGIEDARTGVDRAVRRVGTLVHAPALRSLSDVDRSFLAAMAVDDGPSTMGSVASRLGVDSNYAGQYRLRLIANELIEPAGHGLVDFSLPYLRDYLREHVASDAFRGTRSPAPPALAALPDRSALGPSLDEHEG